jgi:hypothetical protein
MKKHVLLSMADFGPPLVLFALALVLIVWLMIKGLKNLKLKPQKQKLKWFYLMISALAGSAVGFASWRLYENVFEVPFPEPSKNTSLIKQLEMEMEWLDAVKEMDNQKWVFISAGIMLGMLIWFSWTKKKEAGIDS